MPRLVAAPALPSWWTAENGVSTRASTPGSPDVATYTVSKQTDGTRRVIVEPGVVLEVRDPPNTGSLVAPAAIRSFAAVFPIVALGALVVGAGSYAWTGRMERADRRPSRRGREGRPDDPTGEPPRRVGHEDQGRRAAL